jgi:AbrB family looped-hinge helix DNA binding protein
MKKDKSCEAYYGTATIGEKGQIVIPSEAREALGLDKGEKLLVFGMGKDMIALAKVSHLQELTEKLSEKVENLKNIKY